MDSQQTETPAEERPRISRAWLMPAGIGLCLGLGLGIVMGQVAASGDAASTAAPDAVASDIDAADATTQPIADAVSACDASVFLGIDVLDDGHSLQLQTSGKESIGAPFETVLCVLEELDIPESVVSRMESTRALDGRQDAAWSNYSATWGYHPDDGLDVIVETTLTEEP